MKVVPKARRGNGNKADGFTLIELLLVVVIIGILAAIVVPKLAGRSEDARIGAAKAQLTNFRTGLGAYEVDSGKYPSTEQGLVALVLRPTTAPEPKNWKGPYLEASEIPKDPWGREYFYLNPGQKNLSGYDLYSSGPDEQPGTPDDIER
jgi:general secretion pathway protein G